MPNKWAFSATASDDLDDDDWILDTGASCQMVCDVSMLFKADHCASSEVFRQPDGTPLQVTKRGKVCLHTSIDGLNTEIELSSAYFSPKLTRNLVSYGRLADHGCLLGQFQGRHAVLKNGKVVFYVAIKNYVMVIDRAVIQKDNRAIGEIVMSAVATVGSGSAVQVGTLMNFH